jgi:hypothetical protein
MTDVSKCRNKEKFLQLVTDTDTTLISEINERIRNREMKEMYNKELTEIKKIILGATIVSVEHNESADEGMILTLDNGVKVDFGWSGCEGYCKVLTDNTKEK